jgi:hypothetical protein
MKRWSTKQVLHATEYVYAIVALFSLTQGPIYKLWNESATIAEKLPTPSVGHVYFASFIAIQTPAIILWSRRTTQKWFVERSNQVLLLFLSWLSLSVIWSTFARQSLPEALSLAATAMFGLYLGATFSLRGFWFIVASAMALGVGTSWVAVMRLWQGAVNFQEDYWVGIYYNRNSLAPVAAAALIAVVGIAFSAGGQMRSSGKLTVLLAVPLTIALTMLSGIELWQSKSQTSPSALAIALLATMLCILLFLICRRIAMFAKVSRFAVPMGLLITALGVFFAMRYEIGVGGFETATTAFNQRSGLWSLSWDGIMRKPWQGWGWMAAWRDPLFLSGSDEPSWMAWGLEWSHNGYHDLLLGGGVIAGALFATYIWTSASQLNLVNTRDVVPRLILIVYVLAAASQESFFIGSHFMWALLIAALTRSSRDGISIR